MYKQQSVMAPFEKRSREIVKSDCIEIRADKGRMIHYIKYNGRYTSIPETKMEGMRRIQHMVIGAYVKHRERYKYRHARVIVQ